MSHSHQSIARALKRLPIDLETLPEIESMNPTVAQALKSWLTPAPIRAERRRTYREAAYDKAERRKYLETPEPITAMAPLDEVQS